MKCTGLMRITLHFCLCFSEMQFSGRGFSGTGLALETQVAVSREVPGSHYQTAHRRPQLFSGSISYYKGRGITVCPFFLSPWPRESHHDVAGVAPCFLSQQWEDMDGALEFTQHFTFSVDKNCYSTPLLLKWLSLFVGPLGNDPWYS